MDPEVYDSPFRGFAREMWDPSKPQFYVWMGTIIPSGYKKNL